MTTNLSLTVNHFILQEMLCHFLARSQNCEKGLSLASPSFCPSSSLFVSLFVRVEKLESNRKDFLESLYFLYFSRIFAHTSSLIKIWQENRMPSLNNNIHFYHITFTSS